MTDKEEGTRVLSARMDQLRFDILECRRNIEALKYLPILVCSKNQPNFSSIEDIEFSIIAFLALSSNIFNRLPIGHQYSYLSVSTKSEEFLNKSRKELEAALNIMLAARNYELPEEVLWNVVNIKLNGLYNEISDSLYLLEADVNKLPDSRDKGGLIECFTKLKQQTKEEILKNKELDIEEGCRKCLEAFLNNLQSNPDADLGFDTKERLNNIVNILRALPKYTIDLRKMNIKAIGHYLKEMDLGGINILLTAEQESTYLSHKQRLQRIERIFTAIEGGDVGKIKELHQEYKAKEIDIINYADSEGRTPLMRACVAYQVEVVKVLLESGADVTTQTKTGYRAMDGIVLIRGNSQEKDSIIKLLMEYGADTKSIHIAAAVMSLKATEMIYPREVINSKFNGNPVLHMAVLNNNLENVKWLLARGADIELKDDSNSTALHIACELGDEGMVSFLIEKGADFKVKSGKKTAIDIALDYNHFHIVKILRSYGAELGYDSEMMLLRTKEAKDGSQQDEDKKSFVQDLLINRLARTLQVEKDEILKSPVLQQHLVGLAGISTKQETIKFSRKEKSATLEFCLNFVNKKEFEQFNNYYNTRFFGLIKDYTQWSENKKEIVFEMDAGKFYRDFIPVLGPEQKRKEDCIVM